MRIVGKEHRPVRSHLGRHPAHVRHDPAPAHVSAPVWLVAAVRRIEGSSALDAVARRVAPIVDTVLPAGRGRDILQGRWLGHALHPLMTDFPIGAWTSVSLLDFFGGRRSRPAAEGLLLFGLVAAVPTYASGWAEWTTTSSAARRVGLVHAASSVTAVGLYGSSFVARRRGHHPRGVVLALAGGTVVTVAGYLGGHLATVRKIGTSDPGFGTEETGEISRAGTPQAEARPDRARLVSHR